MIENGEKRRQVIEKIGGASRDRTDDLIVANDALSQLSYSPTVWNYKGIRILSVFARVGHSDSRPSRRICATAWCSSLVESSGSAIPEYRGSLVLATPNSVASVN